MESNEIHLVVTKLCRNLNEKKVTHLEDLAARARREPALKGNPPAVFRAGKNGSAGRNSNEPKRSRRLLY